MGPSTTPPATRDAPAPARGVRAGALSPALVLGGKIVLGVAGLGACALLGAGGALLFKHLLAPDPHAVPATVQAAPIRSQAATSMAPSAVPAVVPAPAAPVDAAAPQASAAPVVAAAQTSVPALGGADDAAIEISPRAGVVSRHAPASRVAGRAPGGDESGKAASARADKARCLARVNAITADLSLRNEAPTPQQLVILKRGCQ